MAALALLVTCGGDETSVTDTGASGGSGEAINQGFIGGPCASDADCDYEGGFCLTEAEGFPGGMCSLDCTRFCPDRADAVTTFCVAPETLNASASNGLCIMRCDYGQSPSGCRPGYQCQIVARNEEPETEVYACVPGDDDPFELGACHQELLARGVAFSPAVQPLDSPDGQPDVTCVVEDPVWIEPVLHGVSFRLGDLNAEPTAMFTACPHALAIIDTASVLADFGVSDLVHLGVYDCRTIAGTTTLSEHGRANALDIAGVNLAPDSYFSVVDDWELNQPTPTTTGGIVLRDIAVTLFESYIYNIVLTPDYDADHADHLHCDLTPDTHFMQ